LESLKELMKITGNYKNYRVTIAALPETTACLPFLAPYLSDITVIDENPSRIDGMINMMKCRLLYKVISPLLDSRTISILLSLFCGFKISC